MADTRARKRIRMTSPIGTARWAFVDKPSTKFHDDGQYSVDLVLSPEDGAAMLAQLTPLAEEAKAQAIREAKNPAAAKAAEKYTLHVPVIEELDEAGNETGNYVLKAKRDAVLNLKDPSKPGGTVKKFITIPMFDASSPPKLRSGVRIGRGSKLRVSFEVNPFSMPATKTAGVSLRLSAVQIIELVEVGMSLNPDAHGFGGVDGGYVGADTGPEDAAPFDSEAPGDTKSPASGANF